MTSEEWSSPVLLLPEHRMAEFARFRPTQVEQTFKKRNSDERSLMIAWMDKFETSLSEEQRQKHAEDTRVNTFLLIFMWMFNKPLDPPSSPPQGNYLFQTHDAVVSAVQNQYMSDFVFGPNISSEFPKRCAAVEGFGCTDPKRFRP